MHVVLSIANVTAYDTNGKKLGSFDVPWLVNDDNKRIGASLAMPFYKGELSIKGSELLGVFQSTKRERSVFVIDMCQKNWHTQIRLVREGMPRGLNRESAFEAGKTRTTDIRVFES